MDEEIDKRIPYEKPQLIILEPVANCRGDTETVETPIEEAPENEPI